MTNSVLNDAVFFNSDIFSCWGLFPFAFAAAILFYKSIVIVKPGQRIVVWKRFGAHAGRVRVLESGSHVVNTLTWSLFGQGPFRDLVKNFAWYATPVPLSSVLIDPDRIEIMSADNVPGTANIALEMQILHWDGTDLVGVNVPFRARACVLVNQWVSQQLGKLTASQLCSYAEVVSLLNARDCLKVLNEELARDLLFLEARRVSVDPSGIQLHAEYTSTVGKEIHHRRLLTLQTLEAQALEAAAERRLKLELMQTQAACEQNKLKADVDRIVEKTKADALAARAGALISSGLSPMHAANILVAEVAAGGVGRAEKVFIGMSQGLIGLRGVDHVFPNSSADSVYEKV